MSERLFIRLANQAAPSTDPSLRLVQKAIQDSLWRLLDGQKPTKFALRDFQAMANLDPKDPLSLPMPHQLDGKRMEESALQDAIETARDFLNFYETEDHKRLHLCPWWQCRRYFVDRPNKKYCGPDCKDNYWNRQASVSDRARKAMRKHRAKK
jgi:hypothetical protein